MLTHSAQLPLNSLLYMLSQRNIEHILKEHNPCYGDRMQLSQWPDLNCE